MRAALRILFFSLALIACVEEAALAGSSFSTTASCSIPVVPGLNAPADENLVAVSEQAPARVSSSTGQSSGDQLLHNDAKIERTTLYAR